MQNFLEAIGDSITAGFGATTPYTAQLSLPGGSSWYYNNRGITGQRLSTIHTNVLSYNPVAPHYNVAIVWAGINDFSLDGASPATVFTNLQSTCAALKSQGFTYVLVCTMLSVSGFDTQKNAYNALILADPLSYCDGVVDFTATPLGVDGGYSNRTWFQSDSTHPTQAGINTYEVPLIQAALNALSYPTITNSSFKLAQWAGNSPNISGFWHQSTNQITPSDPLRKGNISVVFAWWFTSADKFQSIQDTAGNTWHQSGPIFQNGTVFGAWFYTLGNNADGPSTISVTNTSAFLGIAYAEYTPPDNSTLSFEAENSFTGATSGNIQASKGDVLVAFLFSGTESDTITPGPGYTARLNGQAFCSNVVVSIEDAIAASDGLTSATATWSGATSTPFGQLLAFKATTIIPPPSVPTYGTIGFGALNGQTLSAAVSNPFNQDLMQVVNEGGEVVWNLTADGASNTKPTSPTPNAILGQFFGSSFVTAFFNPYNLDILQVVGRGGAVVFHVNSQGVASAP